MIVYILSKIKNDKIEQEIYTEIEKLQENINKNDYVKIIGIEVPIIYGIKDYTVDEIMNYRYNIPIERHHIAPRIRNRKHSRSRSPKGRHSRSPRGRRSPKGRLSPSQILNMIEKMNVKNFGYVM